MANLNLSINNLFKANYPILYYCNIINYLIKFTKMNENY